VYAVCHRVDICAIPFIFDSGGYHFFGKVGSVMRDTEEYSLEHLRQKGRTESACISPLLLPEAKTKRKTYLSVMCLRRLQKEAHKEAS